MNWSEFKNIFNDCKLQGEKIVIHSNLLKTIEFVKNNYRFEILKEIIAVDNGDGTTELTYKLFSPEDSEEVLISINVQNEAESVSSIFESAIADEKEIFDLFGIRFNGNPELKRLYMPEDWKGHPLKKDYIENDERLKWNE